MGSQSSGFTLRNFEDPTIYREGRSFTGQHHRVKPVIGVCPFSLVAQIGRLLKGARTSVGVCHTNGRAERYVRPTVDCIGTITLLHPK